HTIPHVFFISSRRRHTRSKRDWSSDVCSSDLNTDQWTFYLLTQIVPDEHRETVKTAGTWKKAMEVLGAKLEKSSELQNEVFDHKIGRASCRERVSMKRVAVVGEKKRKDKAETK